MELIITSFILGIFVGSIISILLSIRKVIGRLHVFPGRDDDDIYLELFERIDMDKQKDLVVRIKVERENNTSFNE